MSKGEAAGWVALERGDVHAGFLYVCDSCASVAEGGGAVCMCARANGVGG